MATSSVPNKRATMQGRMASSLDLETDFALAVCDCTLPRLEREVDRLVLKTMAVRHKAGYSFFRVGTR